ncbi:MAG TPA: efflux RND transporter periplasmic adaptor subunit [Anaerolineales bacterium]|nr:efflux RND transporter periplasmic adaptor subunit [Anaerolineales bacterium]HRQ92289.1 efflux RND transporter periplasmic adaptor subunit [Anaerolineales bacterium]
MITRIKEWFKTMDTRKWFIVGGAALIIIVVALFVRNAGRAAETAASSYQTATVARGNLVASVGATGSVRGLQSAALAWETSGIVEEIHFDVGEVVREGDIIANLLLSSMPANVILSQADLQSAQDAFEDFENSFGDLGISQAQKTLADAQDVYERAQRYLSSISNPGRPVDIDQAQANLVLAQDRLDRAQEAYEPYASRPESDLGRANMLLQVTQAQQQYDAALRQYNALASGSGSTPIAKAEADLALAQAQLEIAQKNYDDILAGPTAQQYAAAQARLAAAQAGVDMGYIIAPFNGTLTDLYPNEGDLVTMGSSAAQVDNLDTVQVVVEVSEVDVNRVQVGQPASVILDAVQDITYEGAVVAVAMAGNTTQGGVNFRVVVELDEPDANVRPGMTAAVTIVVTQMEDVLLIPNRAVRVQNGRRVVYVMRGLSLEAVEVTLGASSETFSEVVAGELKEGDTIVLNPPVSSFDPMDPSNQFMGGFN